MVAKKGDDGSSNDALQKAEDSTMLKKRQNETKKAKDEVDLESCVNNDAQSAETGAIPTLKATTQASKTESKKTNALETGNKQAEDKETEQTKVDVTKKRIRTYLKPRVPSFRKQKKAAKGSNVPASRPMMQKRKPPLPKFHGKKKSTMTKMRVISPRHRVQKARFRRKPPVPRFPICKRRSGALKNHEKPKSKSSQRQNITGYQRRNKRKPALPDFSGRRKQKRLKIAQDEQKQSKSKILDEKKFDRSKQPAKNTNSKDCSISLKTQSVFQKKTNPEMISMPDSRTKTAKSSKNKAISNTSDASKRSVYPSSSKSTCEAQIRFKSKPCAKSVKSSSGKSVKSSSGKSLKLKKGLKFPKKGLGREKNADVGTKPAHSQGSGEKVLTKTTATVSKEVVNKSLTANDKGAVDEANLKGILNSGEKQPPAGGGSMQEVPGTVQSSTVM